MNEMKPFFRSVKIFPIIVFMTMLIVSRDCNADVVIPIILHDLLYCRNIFLWYDILLKKGKIKECE